MKRIIPYFYRLTIFLLIIGEISSAWGSLSVFTEGNPRTYILKESKSSIMVKDAQLYFKGADLKKAFFTFSKSKEIEGLFCEKTKLEASDGKFLCEGYIKRKNKKKSFSFKFDLEPIKNGFKLDAKVKNPELTLKLILLKKK